VGEKADSGELGDDEQVTDDNFMCAVKTAKIPAAIGRVPKSCRIGKEIKATVAPSF